MHPFTMAMVAILAHSQMATIGMALKDTCIQWIPHTESRHHYNCSEVQGLEGADLLPYCSQSKYLSKGKSQV